MPKRSRIARIVGCCPSPTNASAAAATEIYAKAFTKDKDFYAFYRRMEAYKQAFGSGGSTMLLSPDNDFFRFFNDPAGLPAPKP